MNKKNYKRFWRTLLGVQVGDKVMLKKSLWKEYSKIYLFFSTDGIIIPVDKFVGEVLGKDKGSNKFMIKWVACRRHVYTKNTLLWDERLMDVVG